MPNVFFQLVQDMMQRKAELQDGLTVEHVLLASGCWASAVAYISAMSNTVKDISAWGRVRRVFSDGISL